MRCRSPTGVVHTSVHDFRVETVAKVADPYALDFLPDGRILVTEILGGLRIIDKGQLLAKAVIGSPTGDITGMPQPQKRPLLSIAVHPDYKKNGWIYLLHARAATSAVPETTNLATITRGRLRNGHWIDSEDIFSVPTQKTNSLRMKFDAQGYLYVGTPYDRSDHPVADSFARYEGPARTGLRRTWPTPWARSSASRMTAPSLPTIPSWIRRARIPMCSRMATARVMGLAFDAQGELWQTEDGPRGGDEVNHIIKGRNYGGPAHHLGPRVPDAVDGFLSGGRRHGATGGEPGRHRPPFPTSSTTRARPFRAGRAASSSAA